MVHHKTANFVSGEESGEMSEQKKKKKTTLDYDHSI